MLDDILVDLFFLEGGGGHLIVSNETCRIYEHVDGALGGYCMTPLEIKSHKADNSTVR